MRIHYLFFVLGAVLLGFTACDHDNKEPESGSPALITPSLRAIELGSPYTGYLDVYPCTASSSLYYGNYRGRPATLSSLPGFYQIDNGEIVANVGSPILLPIGTYQMLYWGYTLPSDTVISYPSNRDPSIILGGNLQDQAYSLLSYAQSDTLYYSVHNYTYAVQAVNIGSEGLGAYLQRAVAGLKVVVQTKDGEPFDADIDSIRVMVGTIAQQLDFYTAEPMNTTKTVVVPLRISPSRMCAYNAVTLFPSGATPWVIIELTLLNGDVKTYTSNLSSALTAGNMLTLTFNVGDILSTPTEDGNGFNVHDWNESNQTIDTGQLQ